MFDPVFDHEERSLDIPCNMDMHFMIRGGALHLIVHCRSNDMVWGAYGANVVQFSMILEFVARCLNIPVGTYTQVSDSFHVYTEEPSWQRLRDTLHFVVQDPYCTEVEPYPLVSLNDTKPVNTFTNWMDDLDMFMQMSHGAITNNVEMVASMPVRNNVDPFFDRVALPLFDAFYSYKEGKWEEAFLAVNNCHASDWRMACSQWLHRRAR